MSIYSFSLVYYPEPVTELLLCRRLKPKSPLKSIFIDIEYEVTGNEEQGAFLTIEAESIPSYTCLDGRVVPVNIPTAMIIFTFLDRDYIKTACWEDYNMRGRG